MNGAVKLFWTGGWDSTYRLLELLLVLQRPVQPVVVISHDRRSMDIEIQAMNKIKAKIAAEWPAAAARLHETIFFESRNIRILDSVRDSWRILWKQFPLGEQNLYLSSLVVQEGLEGIEVGFHLGDRSFQKLTSRVLEPVEGVGRARLAESTRGSAVHDVWGGYVFPLHDMNKRQILLNARRHGFDHVLKSTWSCHNPTSARRPCGICNACACTIKGGYIWRFPISTLARYLVLRRVPEMLGTYKRKKPRAL